MINQVLLDLARQNIEKLEKQAFVLPGGDPAAAGAPPGMPPDPAAMGMPPGMPPDPAAMGMPPGMPPDPAAMGMPPGMPADPAATMAAPAAVPAAAPGTPQKMKPEDYMRALDYRLFNMQQQISLLISALDVKVDPAAMVHPPGMLLPSAEAAVPGGPAAPLPVAATPPAAAGGTPMAPPITKAAAELVEAGRAMISLLLVKANNV